jgi:hypothetical protein
MSNAYAPPKTAVELPGQAAPPRPIAVMLLQIAGYAVFAIAVIGLVVNFRELVAPGRAPVAFGDAVLVLGIRLLVAAVVAAMLFLVHKRHLAGRVLGIGFIAVFGIPPLLTAFKVKADASIGFSIGAYTACAILLAVAGLWLFHFGFSRKARRYFAAQASEPREA